MTTDSSNFAKTDKNSDTSVIETLKPKLYPEFNNRLKSILLLLGLAFVVAVFLLQQFSGYS